MVVECNIYIRQSPRKCRIFSGSQASQGISAAASALRSFHNHSFILRNFIIIIFICGVL